MHNLIHHAQMHKRMLRLRVTSGSQVTDHLSHAADVMVLVTSATCCSALDHVELIFKSGVRVPYRRSIHIPKCGRTSDW